MPRKGRFAQRSVAFSNGYSKSRVSRIGYPIIGSRISYILFTSRQAFPSCWGEEGDKAAALCMGSNRWSNILRECVLSVAAV